MLENSLIYQINLDHRQDRWEECIKNHNQMGFGESEINRASACRDAHFGALGCAKSHTKILCDFLITGGKQYCLILEDDFDFTVPKSDLDQMLKDAEKSLGDFDVIMLSGSNALSSKTGIKFIEKVFDAQTTCAYLVKKGYIPKLAACFMHSINKLETYRHGNPRAVFEHFFAIDMAWKHLQKEDNWYIFNPVAGVQRPSYSDVREAQVDYAGQFRT